MNIPKSTAFRSAVALASVVLLAGGVGLADGRQNEKKKPSVSVRTSPQAGFSPLRVVVTAELKGGADDYQDFYCPSIEWVWGDDTKSETTADCDPYEPGKSEIKRRYTLSRIFPTAGQYKIEFRMKQKDKVVGSGSTTIRIQPGVRDGGTCCDE